MELTHRFTVPASVADTWAIFNDLEAVAPCFPGAALTSVEGDDFAGTVKVKLGPVSLQYSGTGTFLQRDEATHTARFEAKGKDKRGNGTASASVTAVLLPDGSGTAVEVSTDLNVTGRPAQFGRGLMQDVSDRLLDQFVTCLSEKLQDVSAETPPPAQPEPVTDAGPDFGAAPTESQQAQPVAADLPPPQSVTATLSNGAPKSDPTSTQAPAAELNLGATVLPVLAKRYGPAAAGVLVLLVVLRRLLRR
jgi:carbon monoxide dehydrogenase subunit G